MISCLRIQQQAPPTCFPNQLRKPIKILKRELKISMPLIALPSALVC
jgi:hypothetical protein